MTIACGARGTEVRQALENLCWGRPEEFSSWLLASTGADLPAFDRAAMQADLEEIADFVANYRNGRATHSRQLALL